MAGFENDCWCGMWGVRFIGCCILSQLAVRVWEIILEDIIDELSASIPLRVLEVGRVVLLESVNYIN